MTITAKYSYRKQLAFLGITRPPTKTEVALTIGLIAVLTIAFVLKVSL